MYVSYALVWHIRDFFQNHPNFVDFWVKICEFCLWVRITITTPLKWSWQRWLLIHAPRHHQSLTLSRHQSKISELCLWLRITHHHLSLTLLETKGKDHIFLTKILNGTTDLGYYTQPYKYSVWYAIHHLREKNTSQFDLNHNIIHFLLFPHILSYVFPLSTYESCCDFARYYTVLVLKLRAA